MKTKRFYDPPRVETMNLRTEGFLCASVEDDINTYNIQMEMKDFSGYWTNE